MNSFKSTAEKLNIIAQQLPEEVPQPDPKADPKKKPNLQPKFIREKDKDEDKITYDVGKNRSKSYNAISNIVKNHKADLYAAELWHMPGTVKNISDDYGFVLRTKALATEFTVKFPGDRDDLGMGQSGGPLPKEVADARKLLTDNGVQVIDKKLPATIEGQRQWNDKFHEVERLRGKRRYNEKANKEKQAVLVKKLVALANRLDTSGFDKEAKLLDSLIHKFCL